MEISNVYQNSDFHENGNSTVAEREDQWRLVDITSRPTFRCSSCLLRPQLHIRLAPVRSQIALYGLIDSCHLAKPCTRNM